MSDRYLYNQSGVVLEMCSFVKAILVFEEHKRQHRVIMWVKNFVHEGEHLDHNESLHGKLKVGDPVTFHCHPYDKEDNQDNCGWFAAKAWHCKPDDQPLTVVGHQGCILTLETGKGVLEFSFLDKMETVWFMRSRYFNFGQRVASKFPLSDFITEDQKVQFDASRCKPTSENSFCSWMARIVWKGKKPPAYCAAAADGYSKQGGALASPQTVAGADGEEGEEDGADGGLECAGLYKEFEASGNARSAQGRVLSLLSEEAGVALWMIAPNRWESVFFHRTAAFVDDMSLSKYNLHESYRKDTPLQITAVPAVTEFPCKWVARKVVATS